VALTDLSAVFGILTGIAAVLIAVLAWGGENYLDREVRRRREITVNAAEEIERLSWQDKSTGLFSFSWFNQALEREVSRSGRYDQACTILWLSLDLEHLQQQSPHATNTDPTYIWRFVADLASAAVRDTDSVAKRPGEYSVAILLPQSDIEGGNIVINRLSERLAQEKLEIAGSDPVQVQFRQRAASFPADGATASALINAVEGRR
jgi:GGDEF domain-containing protein